MTRLEIEERRIQAAGRLEGCSPSQLSRESIYRMAEGDYRALAVTPRHCQTEDRRLSGGDKGRRKMSDWIPTTRPVLIVVHIVVPLLIAVVAHLSGRWEQVGSYSRRIRTLEELAELESMERSGCWDGGEAQGRVRLRALRDLEAERRRRVKGNK
jgi:hypothetical protein